MIGWLQGAVRSATADRVLVDTGGIGYLVTVPSRLALAVEEGDALSLHIHTHVREDQIALFGFEEEGELLTFEVLTTVKGVGPKMAVSILDGISPSALAEAVESGDVRLLTQCKGVGKRMAERLALELRGKLGPVVGGTSSPAGTSRAPSGGVWRDLESALSNLQYRKKEIDGALAQLQASEGDSEDFDALLRSALGLLRR